KTRELHISFEGHELAVLAVNEDIDEPAIIFIPGVMAPVNFWLSCLPESVREHRRWYSISLPGHHPSTVPESYQPEDVDEDWFNRLYQSVIQQLVGTEKVIVVGHSTGGFAALNLAANNFESLLGVISVAGFYQGKWGGIEGQLVKLAHLGKWAKPLFIFNLWLSRLFKPIQRYLAGLLAYDRKAFFDSAITQRMLDGIQDNMQDQSLAALFPLFNRIPDLNIEDKLAEISVPTVLMAGTHDPVISAAQSLQLAAEVNEAQLVVFNNAGHMPFMERTEQFNRELLQALTTIAAPALENKT
ncbi:MAG: alpha/beta hydrolase, partial [Cohaesibacteraceae bacterium]|nr:alpha/beta hydrolase [Cohaesibacteraceae bacterium]